jgi:hypothetical protein
LTQSLDNETRGPQRGTVVPRAQDRCVAVVGMGRSGTSATSGLLVKMGLSGPRPDDLVPARSSNEKGHYESKEMLRCNMRLLRAVDSSNDSPPLTPPNWQDVGGIDHVREAARRWFAETYDGRSMVVKDPRLSVTLGFWREMLPMPMAAVFMVRDPLQVARSLEARDHAPITLGLSRWDRYIRSCSSVIQGLPTLVLTYDDLLADPVNAALQLSHFLEKVGVELEPGAAEAASSHIDAKLRHQVAEEEDELKDLARTQREMFDMLVARKGVYEVWDTPPPFPPAPLWVDDTLELRREYKAKCRELRLLRRHLAHPAKSAVRVAKRRLSALRTRS